MASASRKETSAQRVARPKPYTEASDGCSSGGGGGERSRRSLVNAHGCTNSQLPSARGTHGPNVPCVSRAYAESHDAPGESGGSAKEVESNALHCSPRRKFRGPPERSMRLQAQRPPSPKDGSAE